jgi:signal transduction histidine kinase
MADTSARAAAVASSLRGLSHRLHPGHLRLVGLTSALGQLQRELSTSDVAVTFSHENVPATLSYDIMLCLYRVAQEAVTNAVKHSRAQSVSVHVRGTRGAVVMTVDDDGAGFDVGTAARGLGLLSMSERVEQIGGTLQVRSERGRGTHVEVGAPCDARAAGGDRYIAKAHLSEVVTDVLSLAAERSSFFRSSSSGPLADTTAPCCE